LVFHDLDKLTSVFIHLFPALVTFCLRWYSHDTKEICTNENCQMSLEKTILVSLGFYIVWQILYLIKTEVLDAKKLQSDTKIMTSVRWMSEVKPHPLWIFFEKHGAKKEYASIILVGFQFIYTIITFFPVYLIYHWFELHVFYLSLITLICIWNGANFYFEIFSETYSKRLQRFIRSSMENSSSSSTTTTTIPSSSMTTKTTADTNRDMLSCDCNSEAEDLPSSDLFQEPQSSQNLGH